MDFPGKFHSSLFKQKVDAKAPLNEASPMLKEQQWEGKSGRSEETFYAISRESSNDSHENICEKPFSKFSFSGRQDFSSTCFVN